MIYNPRLFLQTLEDLADKIKSCAMDSDWLRRERSQGIYLLTYVDAKIVTLKTVFWEQNDTKIYKLDHK